MRLIRDSGNGNRWHIPLSALTADVLTVETLTAEALMIARERGVGDGMVHLPSNALQVPAMG